MRNIHDWCISRQLWWGHRIPAFTCANGHVTVADEDPEACADLRLGGARPGPGRARHLVLLAALAVLGLRLAEGNRRPEGVLPDRRPRHGVRHPLLLGGADDHGGHALHGSAPFSTGQPPRARAARGREDVQDAGERRSILSSRSRSSARTRCASRTRARPPRRARPSRSSGSASPARATSRPSSGTRRASRSRSSRGSRARRRSRAGTLSLPDRWILSRLSATAADVNRQLEAFRFDEAAQALYAFLWHELCDGYLEMVKPVLSGREADEAARETARGVLRRCLADSLALLHPFMPFLTEEIWEKLTGAAGDADRLALSRRRARAWRTPRPRRRSKRCARSSRACATSAGSAGSSPTEPVELSVDPASPSEALDDPAARASSAVTSPGSRTCASGRPRREPSATSSRGSPSALSLPAGAAGADREQVARTLAADRREIERPRREAPNPRFSKRPRRRSSRRPPAPGRARTAPGRARQPAVR